MVEPSVPIRIRTVDARDGVERLEELNCRRSIKMCRPIGVVASNAIRRVECRCGTAGVSRLQGVNGIGLDEDLELCIGGSRKHTHDKLARDLGRDHIVGHAVGDLAGVKRGRDEVQKGVVDAKQILSMLARVVEPAFGNLWELAGAVETLWGEGIGWGGVDLPIDLGGFAIWVRDSVIEERFVVAFPGVGLVRECVGSVGCSLVVAVDLKRP